MIEIDLIRHVKVSGKPALYGFTDVLPVATENDKLLSRLIKTQNINPYHEIISSPLIRCQGIATAFSQNSKVPLTVLPTLKEMNFGDYDGVPFDLLSFGKDELARRDEVERIEEKSTADLSWTKIEAFFQTPASVLLPNAESLSQFHARIISGWQKLIESQINVLEQGTVKKSQGDDKQYSATNLSKQSLKKSGKQTPKRILVVVHGGVIRMILAHILQLDWKNPALYQQLHIGNASLTRISITPHSHNNKSETHQQVTTIGMPLLEGL